MITPRAWIRHVAVAQLPPLSYRVAIKMLDYADWEGPHAGGNIRPGLKRLTEDIGLDADDLAQVDRVKKAVKALVQASLLYLTHRSTGIGNANIYAMTTPARTAAFEHRKVAELPVAKVLHALTFCASFSHRGDPAPATHLVTEMDDLAICAECADGIKDMSYKLRRIA